MNGRSDDRASVGKGEVVRRLPTLQRTVQLCGRDSFLRSSSCATEFERTSYGTRYYSEGSKLQIVKSQAQKLERTHIYSISSRLSLDTTCCLMM